MKRYLCGDDESLFEDLADGSSVSGEEYFTNTNDPGLARLHGKRGIPVGVTATAFRVEVSVDKGKSNFRLHAIISTDVGNSSVRRQPNTKQTKQRPRSQKNVSLQYPFRILSLRENENLID